MNGLFDIFPIIVSSVPVISLGYQSTTMQMMRRNLSLQDKLR